MYDRNSWRALGIGRRALAAVPFLLGPAALAFASAGASDATTFEHATVRFEQNATDGDFEAVFEITGGDDGLAKLKVVSPDGRVVVDFAAPDASTMGIRSFALESPEPADVAGLKAAYPEGAYRFTATTSGGEELRGEYTLRHGLPATISFLRPESGAEGVPTEGLEIAWSPVANASRYIVELEQDDLGVKLKAELPGSVNTFSVPRGLLAPDTEYVLGIASVTEEGNLSFVETSFTTAESE